MKIYSQDIGMGFDIEKCAISGKWQITEGTVLSNQIARRKGKLQVVGNIRSGHQQTSGNEKENK